jgi:hypothetical protein
MRITTRVDDDLLTRARELAIGSGRTLTAVIEDALRAALARNRGGRRRERTELPTFGSGGVRPGVDLDNAASLLDVVESNDPS